VSKKNNCWEDTLLFKICSFGLKKPKKKMFCIHENGNVTSNWTKEDVFRYNKIFKRKMVLLTFWHEKICKNPGWWV
jgi:hypothetical protein